MKTYDIYYGYDDRQSEALAKMIGQTITRIEGGEKGEDEILFHLESGEKVYLFHAQNCCEHVAISDREGDLQDLIGSPLTLAEVVTRSEEEDDPYGGSITWTFYKFATVKGYVDFTWRGESNGYYSEAVDMKYIYVEEVAE